MQGPQQATDLDGVDGPVHRAEQAVEESAACGLERGTVLPTARRRPHAHARAQARATHAEARQRLLFDAAAELIGILDRDGGFVDVNAAAVVHLGVPRAAIIGAPFARFVPEDALGEAFGHFMAACDGETRQFELPFLHAGTARRVGIMTAAPLRDGPDALDPSPSSGAGSGQQGAVTGVLIVVRDATDERTALAAEATARSLLEATLEAVADGVLVVDRAGRATRWNRRFAELWRMPAALLEAGAAAAIVEHVANQVADPAAFRAGFDALQAAPECGSADRIACADGRVYERVSQPQRVGDVVVGRVWSFRDVTERVALEAQLTHQAYHDPLTGLANRAQFRHHAQKALTRAAVAGRDPDRVAVLLLDLDGFKRVNDTLGHAAGDALLVEVADRLRHATRGSDLVARLGGDEVAVLLDRVRSEADALVVAERIAAALHAPVAVQGTHVVVGASVGVARGAAAVNATPGPALGLGGGAGAQASGAGAVAPVDALLRNADLALYDAKARGKGQHALYNPALHAAAVARVTLETALRNALERDELRLVYQPIVDLSAGRVCGVEALVRWAHPTRGLVPPAEFIPLAEETGLVVPLGRWVLRAACARAAAWVAEGGACWATDAPLSGDADAVPDPTPPEFYVTVNVSGRQLHEPGFVEEVAQALAWSELAPAHLMLELTESAVIAQPDLARTRLEALKALGVRLAVDDFGTGYSALAYLQRFPFDVLKIDRSFVEHVAEGGPDAALARAIVALGHALALRTVAEGVETPAQQAALEAMGCRYGQGYLFARPLAAEDVDGLLRGPVPSRRDRGRVPASA